MAIPVYTIVCTFKKLIARGVYELRFSRPAGFTFKPGQFVLFDVPLVNGPHPPAPFPTGRGGDLFQTRALSIASTPEESDLLFVVKLLPGGRLSRWIEEVLKEGSKVSLKGPFGNFVLTPSPPDPLSQGERGSGLFFIATGAGIAPFRPMVLQALTLHQSLRSGAGQAPGPSPVATGEGGRRIDILFGVRSEEDLFWKDWLEDISRDHPNVFHHIALSQPSPSWTGHRGRVQAVAPQIVGSDFTQKTLYVCGNPDMTTDVKRLALGEWGMEKKDVHVEGYI